MNDGLRQTIFALMRKILKDQGVAPVEITLDARIGDLGMSSMSLAELVSELEQRFDVDPFDAELSITDIVSVRDLVSAYEQRLPA